MPDSKSTRLILSLWLFAIPLAAFAGPVTSGGGFYANINGQWILLDEVEAGTVVDPQTDSRFATTRDLVDQADRVLPGFGAALGSTLTKKIWRVVPYELHCENPATPVGLPLVAAACQDEFDVWIQDTKLNSSLIVHELVQGLRLTKNARDQANIKPGAVRAVSRALISGQQLDESELQSIVYERGFGKYMTASEFATYIANSKTIRIQEREAQVAFNARIKSLLESCNHLTDRDELKACRTIVVSNLRNFEINPQGATADQSDEFRDTISKVLYPLVDQLYR